MAKTGQDATIYRNNRVVLRFTVLDEDAAGEPPLDITTYLIKYAIARLNAQGDPIVATPVIDLNSTTHPTKVVKTDATQGKLEVILDETDTDDLSAPRDYYHELEVFDSLGNPVVAATGVLSVLPNVTNA